MSKIKIDLISDLHMGKPKLDGGDLLLCAGDLTFRGEIGPVKEMLMYLNKVSHYYLETVFIAGNHDFLFERNPALALEMVAEFPNLTYLNDQEHTTYHGLKIWGSPITPWFNNWAFNRYRGKDIQEHWDLIPKCDILMTHGPPHGILDKTLQEGIHVGCEGLLAKIKEIQPKLHFFGHLHETYGTHVEGNTTFINASVMNLQYEMINKPVTVLIDTDNKNVEIQE